MSIWPAIICAAIWLTAVRPDEHWRLTVAIDVETGMPAWRAAMRAADAPPPGGRTFPTLISSTSAGSRLTFVYTARRMPERISSGRVSLKPPRLACETNVSEESGKEWSSKSNFGHSRAHCCDNDHVIVVLRKDCCLARR